MKVFISWSGEKSKTVAYALRDWLPNVIQAVEPWMSDTDLDKGSRWNSDMSSILEEAKIGIICLTPENLDAPWILFEAGALSKSLDETYVCPYLIQVESANIEGPLVQFQMTKANKNDTKKLVDTINRALEIDNKALDNVQLDKTFEIWWPQLEKALKNIPDNQVKHEPQRSEREILEEILELARIQAKHRESPALDDFRKYLVEYDPQTRFKLRPRPKKVEGVRSLFDLGEVDLKNSQSEKDKEND